MSRKVPIGQAAAAIVAAVNANGGAPRRRIVYDDGIRPKRGRIVYDDGYVPPRISRQRAYRRKMRRIAGFYSGRKRIVYDDGYVPRRGRIVYDDGYVPPRRAPPRRRLVSRGQKQAQTRAYRHRLRRIAGL